MNKGFIYAITIHVLFVLSVVYIPKQPAKNFKSRVKITKVKLSFQKKPEVKKIVPEVKKEEKTEVKQQELIKREEPVKKKEVKEEKKPIKKKTEQPEKQKQKKKVVEKKPVKKEIKPEDSIFNNIPDQNTTGAIAEEDLLTIQEQIQNNWNLTPCRASDGAVIRLQVIVTGDCELIYRNLLEGPTEKVCSQSAIRAVRNVGELNLPKEKCVEYSKSAITLSFNVPVD